ncbi:MAG TPA: NHLP bacteriocin system secretion protein [Cyanobacteria bacterium UBA8803]|nr:NHLP bacteriocin system secretion protein [Cyanobacteria bacterium UBA9273]HBL61659.1 NHLP bacteriocin system secretion protein [Cyanobacteria bacterium UBA8803]
MPDPKKSIFRQKSLDRLSSPESLDQLIQVVSPQDWLPLSVLGGLVLVGSIWSIVGKLPITVSGQGVLLPPRRVVEIQSPLSGQLKELKVKVGDCVKKNNGDNIDNPAEMLAVINPLELKQQKEREQLKLQKLKDQDLNASNLELQRTQLEKAALLQQQETFERRLRDNQSLSPVLRNRNSLAIQQQRISQEQRLKDLQALAPTLQERLQRHQELAKEGALPADRVLEAEQQFRQNQQSISEVQAQLKQLDVQETESEQKYQETINTISDLQAQLRELETKEKTLAQQNLESATNRKNQILEVELEIAKLDQQIKANSTIKSPHTGCILELTATEGQVVAPGTRIGSMQIEQANQQIVGVTYFAVKDGKLIKPGMQIQITPTTVKRERFGGIVGTVISVSPFPVTKQGAANVIGNPDIVESLMGKATESQIEVWAKLQPNSHTSSGYEWSSSTGPPNLQISAGTTTTVRVTVERRAPITFVLPFLREWSGIN